jgi:D-arabinose 1-dehydrogenase-like Zn-dependent alcohol dehydrogenase/glycosyltransferase involved in cell wall biosynthesis
MSIPETSIIIRTFNEERYLPCLLEAIQGQRYRDFELINVDSGSYDRTTEIAQQHGARLLRISSQDFTFGYSLNVGIQAARGRFMVIVSAHAKPVDDGWLERLVAPLRRDGVAMVYGRQFGVASSKYGEVRDLQRTFGPVSRVLKPPYFFANNANSAVRRELWQQHPFDEGLPGQEDIEWAKHWMERGHKVVYEADAGVYHIHHESWRQVRRRYYREALATRAIGVWHRRDAARLALREVGYLAADVMDALLKGELLRRGSEIFLFRLNKGYGALAGLLDGKVLSTPVGRDSLFFDRKCKAVVVRGRNQASLEEIDVPAVKPGDVLVQVAYAGVSSADLDAFSGDASYPAIPGRELSGWVARVGANVIHLKQGDPVMVASTHGCGSCTACRDGHPALCRQASSVSPARHVGAYAEYLSAPGRFVHRLPDGLDMAKAVLCEPLAAVLRGLNRLNGALKPGMEPPRCAILDTGLMGHLCARVLAAHEYTVTVFGESPDRLRAFEGAAVSTNCDFRDLRNHDVVIAAADDSALLNRAFELSGPGAALLLLGLPYQRRQLSLQAGVELDKTIVWSIGAGPDEFKEAVRLLPQLPLDDLTSCVYPLARFAEAWESFRSGENLKVLLKVS